MVNRLTDLLRKDRQWEWSSAYQNTIEGLKKEVSSKLVLKLLNFEAPFKVHEYISSCY